MVSEQKPLPQDENGGRMQTQPPPLEHTNLHPQIRKECSTPLESSFAAESCKTAANILYGKGGYLQYRRELMQQLTAMCELHPLYFNPLELSQAEYHRMCSSVPVHSLHAT